VWHHNAGQILTPAALTTSPDRTCVPGAPRSAAAFVLSPSGLAPSVVLGVAQGIRAGVSSGPATVNVSADGRVVAFESHVPLLSADTNGVSDIYVLDLRTRDLTLASQTPDGSASNGSSTHPGLSGDGRYIVFESLATNLVAAPDLNKESDVFIRDSHAVTTSRISVPPGGGSTNGWSRNPVIAADGDSVAFDSVATNLSPGLDANGYGSDVYVFHVSTGLVRRVSVTTSGAQPSSGVSFAPAISADGRFIAFTSRAELGCALQPTSEPQRGASLPSHVYVRDLGALVTHCVSGGTRDRRGKGSSYHAAIDHAGRMVAFVSEATNLGIQDRNHAPDVYLYDLVTDATRLVTRSVRGRPASGDSLHPAISGNGRFVVFESAASDLVCARGCPGGTVDHNLVSDVYLFDVATDGITRLSTENGNEPWWQASRGPALSADAGTIAFSSRHPVSRGDVVDDDDLFVLMSCVLSAPPHEVRTESVSTR
jgi:Tol biopolymer transport system component